MNNLWTQNDIEALTDGYLAGATLKEMAIKFNRSTSAVNKALSRFGIRRDLQVARENIYGVLRDELKGAISRKVVKSLVLYCKRKPQKHQKIKSLSASLTAFHQEYMLSAQAAGTEWVEMHDLLNYLRRHHIVVFEVKDKYFIDHQSFTKEGVLKLVNTYREAENKQPWYVKGVTA